MGEKYKYGESTITGSLFFAIPYLRKRYGCRDLERKDAPLYNVKGHNGLINSIDGCGGLNVGSGAPELVTAGRDGCVRVWDPRVRDPVVSLEPESSEQARDCWTACFGMWSIVIHFVWYYHFMCTCPAGNAYTEEERCICAGYDNGDVKLFDLRTNKFRWETNVGNGVVCTEFDRKDIDMNKVRKQLDYGVPVYLCWKLACWRLLGCSSW